MTFELDSMVQLEREKHLKYFKQDTIQS